MKIFYFFLEPHKQELRQKHLLRLLAQQSDLLPSKKTQIWCGDPSPLCGKLKNRRKETIAALSFLPAFDVS